MSAGAFRVESKDLRRFSAAMVGADVGLRRRVQSRLRKVAAPIGREVRSKGAAGMPRRGGLRNTLQRAAVRTSVVGWSIDPTVQVELTADGASIPNADRGVIVHPVFGNRGVWVRQNVPAGSWTKALRSQESKMRDALGREINAVVRDVARKSN